MKKKEVEIGQCYRVKISGKTTVVQITHLGNQKGWWAVNLRTGRDVRIKSAAKLRKHVGDRKRAEAYLSLLDKIKEKLALRRGAFNEVQSQSE